MTTIEEYEDFLEAMSKEDAYDNLLRLADYLRLNDTYRTFIRVSILGEKAFFE